MDENIAQGNYSFKVRYGFNTVHYLAFKGDLQLLERAVEKNGVESGSKYLESPLMVACLAGKIDAVKFLLNKGANINFVEERNFSALDFAVEANRIDVLRLLVERNVEKRILNIALVRASRKASYPMVELLLRYCNVDLVDGNYWSLLFQASTLGKMDLVKLLLSKGANLELKNKDGSTALMTAMAHGHYEIAKYLIENGALLDISNNFESTALLSAANLGSLEMVKFFVDKGAKLDKVCKNKGTALKGAVISNNFELVKYIVETLETLPQYASGELLKDYLNLADIDRSTALIHACKHKDADMIKYLVEKGSSAKGVTAIAVAAKHSSLDSVKYLLECEWNSVKPENVYQRLIDHAAAGGNVEVIKFLIEKGIDINEIDDDGNYPLLLACSSKSMEAVDLLLKNGAVEQEENPAIIFAAKTGCAEMVKLMLDNGSKVKCFPDEDYYRELTTPLQEAVYSGSMETVKLLVDWGADVNWFQGDDSPFNAAVLSGRFDIANYLVRQGARTDADESETGNNLLHITCFDIKNNKLFDYMLQFDECIHKTNHKGRTPLFIAAKKMDHYKVERLVSRGAKANVQDNNGVSALSAAMNCYGELNEVLLMRIAENPDAKNRLMHRTIKCLVDNGADVNSVDEENFELLKWALKVQSE